MKALDHYNQGERLEQQQANLDAASYSETIPGVCHGAAHHYICAGLEWAGVKHGHAYSKHSTRLWQAAIPTEIPTAWDRLDRLLAATFIGEEINGPSAQDARTHLATIKGWAQSLHP